MGTKSLKEKALAARIRYREKEMKKIAVIGDIHGCVEELKTLYDRLCWLSLDEIWAAGDLVDRGPDSGGVVRFCRKNRIQTVMGNHEESILKLWDARAARPDSFLCRNEDKLRTINQLTEEDIDFLRRSPKLHVFDENGLLIVHGGLWPRVSWQDQPHNVVRAQMIHPGQFGGCRWWGKDAPMGKSKRTEEESRAEGWVRWYEIYDHEYDVVYGHSVFTQPFIHQNPGAGRTIGIDTASCFGGMVTAGIFSSGEPFFVSVKAKEIYFALTRRLVDNEY